jgi:hypothetical protein
MPSAGGSVKQVTGVLAAEGGYILAPSHHIQYHVPAENIIALYETGKNFASIEVTSPGKQDVWKGSQS